MTDLLVTTFSFGVLAVIACVLGVAVTVAPIAFAVDLAERRRFSTVRWGVLTGLGIVGALVLGLTLMSSGAPLVVLVLSAALAWAVPVALAWVPQRAPVGGRPGRHE